MIINRWGYVVGSRSAKDFHIAKYRGNAFNPEINIGDLKVPRSLTGKRIRLKVEVLEDTEFNYE